MIGRGRRLRPQKSEDFLKLFVAVLERTDGDRSSTLSNSHENKITPRQYPFPFWSLTSAPRDRWHSLPCGRRIGCNCDGAAETAVGCAHGEGWTRPDRGCRRSRY